MHFDPPSVPLFWQLAVCSAVHSYTVVLGSSSLLVALLVFVIFCTKEEGYPLEASTDDRCFFSPAVTDGFLTKRLAQSYRHFVVLTEAGADKKHLSFVLVSNGYPSSFVQKITEISTVPRREPMTV